jgi:membrane protease YdiL (CAAX protease family)
MNGAAVNPETKTATAPVALDERALAAWEIVSIATSVLTAEWLLAASVGMSRLIAAIPLVLAFVLIISSQRLHRESLHEIGFRFDNFFRAVKLLLLPMIVVSVLSLLIGIALRARPSFLRWHADRSIFLTLAISSGWGLLQHYVLQSFINRRAQLIWGAGWLSVLTTAAIFALLHLPNPTLTVATFAGGLVWAAIYQRAPNLFTLALSHAAMSWVIVATLPESLLNHSRIGLKYFF